MNQLIQHKCYEKAWQIEDQLINIAIFNKEASVLVSEIPSEEFYREENRHIKDAIAKLLAEQKVPSVTSIYNMLSEESRKVFMDVSTCQAFGDPFTLLQQFKDSHRLCDMNGRLHRLAEIAGIGSVEKFNESFDEFLEKHSMKESLVDAQKMSEIMALPLLKQEKSYQFFDVPIPSLAKLVPKIRTGQYICISGAPAMGKSTMACIFAEKIPKMLMISYEMDSEEIHDTIVSRNAGVDSRLIEFDTMSFEQKNKVDTQRRVLKDKLSMLITDTPPRANDLYAYIRRMKQKHDINGVVIDYAQLISGLSGKGNKVEQYEELSRKFKQIARELKIVVIALSSINGASLKEGRAPNLSDLRGSLSFGADADTVIFTYGVPSEQYGKEDPACSVAKQRKGLTGKVEGFKYLKPIHLML